MQNLSYENELYLHVNENSFSYERLCTKTRFEKEVQDNSEMENGNSEMAYLFEFWWLKGEYKNKGSIVVFTDLF